MDDLASLIEYVRDHDTSFYRDVWGPTSDIEVPVLMRNTLAITPLDKRRYTEGQQFVRLVSGDTPFLSSWRREDIAREELPAVGRKPLSAFESSHDALYHALWCYEHQAVPLIAERSRDVTMYTAREFKVSDVLCDMHSSRDLIELLSDEKAQLETVSVIDQSFDVNFLRSIRAASVYAVLAFPETGVLGTAMVHTDDVLHFTPAHDVIFEHQETLIVTKLRRLVTPIIRYDTGLRSKSLPAQNSFTLNT